MTSHGHNVTYTYKITFKYVYICIIEQNYTTT